MKSKIYFSIVVIGLSAITVHAQQQQVSFKENAIKVAALVPGIGETPCKLTSKPCAITNKSPDRTISVRVEESFLVNNMLRKVVLELKDIVPNENRYIGCAGCTKDDLSEKCTGYKILMAYYEQPDFIRVRAIFYDDPTKAVTSK